MGIAERLRWRDRDRAMVDAPTDEDSTDHRATDEHRVQRHTHDSDPLAELGPRRGSLENQRVVSVVRQRLFGSGVPPRVGRYAIERRLGSGGMGEVYLARDDALDRKVAIKRVHTRSVREHDQERLRREARALARLSHPNVVQVYEVDEHQGRTFVAMEYVDGQTLGEWLAERPRPWQEVLRVFDAAGHGLAAAHSAGLVHRDFKPDNVLLGRDGSVRVADFGLVLAGDDRRTEALGDPPAASTTNPRISSAGAIIGTIRYMALEQLCGDEVDARSDQFSFCVALYEALWGEAPFSLTGSAARLADLEAARPAVPGRGGRSRPPAALWRVIRQGLSKAPADRWPDMPALLGALHRVARRRRRLAWGTGLTVAATVAVGSGALMVHEPPTDPCATVQRELHGIWDPERLAALEAGVAGLDVGHARDSQQRVLAGLDRWSTEWVEARQQACRAHADQHVEPELAHRMSTCLTRQRQRVRGLVDLLVQPGLDGDTLAKAVSAVAQIPQASACDDELALMGVDPPPPAIADQVSALRQDIDHAHELRVLGRVDEAMTLAERSEREARTLGYGPLHAEALAEFGKTEATAGSLPSAMLTLQIAIDTAERHRHDQLVAKLWIDLALRSLTELDDAVAGTWQLRRAQVSNERIGVPPDVQARLTHAHGLLEEMRGEFADAEQSFRSAVARVQSDPALIVDHMGYSANLARFLQLHRPASDEGLRLQGRALELAETHFGPKHPRTAMMAYLLAIALQNREPNRAAELFLRAARIWTASHARPHRELARARLILAKRALSAGQLDDAMMHTEQLATIQAQSLPEDHTDHGQPAYLRATIYAVKGDHEVALEQARIALALWEPSYGMNDAIVQRLHGDTASLLLSLGRLDEAAEALDRLLPHVQGWPAEVPTRVQRAELALRQGRLDLANSELRTLETRGEDDLGAHEFSYALLRALLDVRRGHRDPEALDRLRRARSVHAFTPQQLSDWYSTLDMTDEERTLLTSQ